MEKIYSYPAIFREDIEEETDRLGVTFPDLPWCISCGDDLEDAYEMAADALATALNWLCEEGKNLPVPTKAKEIPVKKYESVHIIRVNISDEWGVCHLRMEKGDKKLVIPGNEDDLEEE